jgi:flagellar biogenesis protein FliO
VDALLAALGTAVQPLGSQVQDLPFPGIGRLVFGFTVTVALAVAAAYVLRRYWSGRLGPRAAAGTIRSVATTNLSSTLKVHVIEVESERFLVAESRGGLSVAPLSGATGQHMERPS